MWYVASQIVLCLLLAALLGFLIGWLLRKRWYSDRLAEVESTWKSKFDAQGLEVQEARNQCKELDSRLSALQDDLAAKEKSLKKLRDLEPLPDLLKERDAELAGFDARLKKALAEKEEEIAFLKRRGAELEPLTRQLADCEERLRGADEQLRLFRQEKEAEISNLKARLGKIDRLWEQLGERDQQLREGDGRFASALREKNEEIGILLARIAELEALLKQRAEELEQARLSGAAKRTQKDDLKKIHGVGPVLARMLHKLGIHTFREVALWKDEDIDRVDEQLEHFRGRIRREGWVYSAKEEHFKKYVERL